MSWTRRNVLGGAVAGLGLSVLPATAQVTGGQIVEIDAFPSRHIAARKVLVWLPAAYDARRSARFPVIYMHDGQNLFDGKAAFAGEWGVDEAITRMAARGDLRDTIVVGVANTAARYREYFPQKVAAHLPEAYRAAVLEMAGGPLLGDAYLRFIVEELKPAIDARFRTLRGAADTSVMGSSMGGLISLYAIGEYPRVFGQAACLSIHLPLAAPMALYSRPPEGPEAVGAALRAWLTGSAFDPARNRVYFDHGTATLDAAYPPFAAAIDAMLPTLGWVRGETYEIRSFTGTEHNERAWRERIDIPLAFLDHGR
ncbi:enterochelin esterase-like enzyme [Sphingomonas sp. BE123]|jgi:enterochelin esterase-like enzyme|uniref:alpha/beta hydrolase n=1 Tax=Sphingomonas sp. BE123 TaxID=2817842 RepID=UPI0028558C3E|nr:alpha/beta hydrolase-fold protein [Sphingomonas sp. BE123]MDR6851972.1 enterochelin esterase-like enzyme [Sphingomonas sp. BE123]